MSSKSDHIPKEQSLSQESATVDSSRSDRRTSVAEGAVVITGRSDRRMRKEQLSYQERATPHRGRSGIDWRVTKERPSNIECGRSDHQIKKERPSKFNNRRSGSCVRKERSSKQEGATIELWMWKVRSVC